MTDLRTGVLFLASAWMLISVANLPKRVAADSFDIEARAEGNPSKDQMRLMMQALVADRFRLAVHLETPEAPVLALHPIKPGKTGLKLRSHADGPSCDATVTGVAPDDSSKVFPPQCNVYMLTSKPDGMHLLGSRNTTMDLLAASLSPFSGGRPVVDRTGLVGRFDFTLEWATASHFPVAPNADAQPGQQGPTLLEAPQEQLGLKVESTKAPIPILVVDHVERPSDN